MQDNSQLNNSLINLLDIMDNIEFFDKNMQLLVQNIDITQEVALEEFATKTVSIQFGVENFLDDIHTILAGTTKQILNKPALLVELLNHMEVSFC